MDLADIADGLATALDTIVGLRTYPYQPDSPAPPCVIVLDPESAAYHSDFDGGVALTIPLLLLVGRISERSARNTFNGYLSTATSDSLKDAVEEDRTLGGTVDDVTVTGFRQIQPYTFGEVTYVGVELVCEVLAS